MRVKGDKKDTCVNVCVVIDDKKYRTINNEINTGDKGIECGKTPIKRRVKNTIASQQIFTISCEVTNASGFTTTDLCLGTAYRRYIYDSDPRCPKPPSDGSRFSHQKLSFNEFRSQYNMSD